MITGLKQAGEFYLYVQEQSPNKCYKAPNRGKSAQNTRPRKITPCILPLYSDCVAISTPLNVLIVKVWSVCIDATAASNPNYLYWGCARLIQ